MAVLKVINLDGTSAGEVQVADAVFASDVKEHLLWEVVRYQLAARRAGTAKVKERWEVHGTHNKMNKQKGSGNARHSSRRVNLWRGGGQVHGPRPRSYAFHVNRKVMAGALRSALTVRAQAGDLLVMRNATVSDAKTKSLATALNTLGTPRALLVDEGTNVSLQRASRNLASASFLDERGLNVYDILRFPKLLVSEASLRRIEARLQGESK
jgi:large subunit ribosomal protein L4